MVLDLIYEYLLNISENLKNKSQSKIKSWKADFKVLILKETTFKD